ncbi:MAG TPA: GatB/YqeY domain-containing protein [Actinomycetota bacterium]|nr:GatB/YqeY domain-containing protein [Actinomycetota bacterium]
MTSLKERIREDLTAAMRARDETAKATLRSVITAISKAEVSGKQQSTLNDDQVIGVIRSELGKRKEAAEIYDKAGRDELAAQERSEAEILSTYMPEEIGDEALAAIVAEEVANARNAGIEGPRAMGAVIKAVRERVGAAAEGSRISQVVKAALAG